METMSESGREELIGESRVGPSLTEPLLRVRLKEELVRGDLEFGRPT